MAQWKETLEPYVKVIESVKSTTINPTAGEDLIIGAVIISDAGPSAPTLISSQKEFLATYASEEISRDYTDSLDELYTGENATLASTMWLNAYRLAGSGNLLISRASKADNLIYSKPLAKNSNDDYILRDNEVLKAVESFKFVTDFSSLTSENITLDKVTSANDGWAISIKDIGVIGNRVNNNGPLYDYYVDNLYDLVQKLNETTKFYSPSYKFYSDAACTTEVEVNEDNKSTVAVKAVKFDVVYLAPGGIMEPKVVDAAGNIEYWGTDTSGVVNNWGDKDAATNAADVDSTGVGCAYILPETATGSTIINLNSENYSGFETPKYYASNLYNSRRDLKVRIRRFNHNAVQSKATTAGSTESPYTVLSAVLDVYTSTGTAQPNSTILEYDFYEFMIEDSSISSEPLFFNVGTIGGRGDITAKELNDSLSLIHLTLPDNLKDLKLNYYGYSADDTMSGTSEEISVNLKLGNGDNTKPLLNASNADIMKAWDRIEEDERYIVEGMTDLGCTETVVQNYMANIAVNSNYFYSVSTANSTNYMVIASKKQKITQDSCKLYFCSPWDYDDGTVGYLFCCSPSVLYWETVLRNRRNNQEFAAAFGQNRGIISCVSLAKEFKKSERQLLLTKKINTAFHDVYLDLIYWNDNQVNQTEDNVLKEENCARAQIRVSKAIPVLVNQFKGAQNSPKTRSEAKDVIDYWFRTYLMALDSCPITDWRITCDDSNNTDEDVRANRLNIKVQCRFIGSVKYIEVLNIALPIGLEFEE